MTRHKFYPDYVKQVKHYYHSLESILGYRLLIKGVKHFGYHDNPKKPYTVAKAQTRQNDLVAEKLNLKSGAKILECGCGEGSSANHIAKKYGYKVTGVDILPMNILRAKRKAERDKTNVDFLVADYMKLPFGKNQFDGVYAMETLVHAPDPIKLFKGINRVLKPGGKLVFCEYSMTPRNKISQRGKDVMTKMNTYGYMPSLEQFTHGAFPEMLRSAGFKNITTKDLTENVKPTLKYFYSKAHRKNKIIKKLGLEKRFINTFSTAEIYEAFMRGEVLVKYNLVEATKS